MNKAKYIIKVENKDWHNYDDKFLKIKFKLNGHFHLGEKLKMHNVVTNNNKSTFYGNNYPNIYLNGYFYKIDC